MCFLWLIATQPVSAVELTRCNGFNDAATAWAAVAAGSDEPLPLHGLDPPVLLPDGSDFKTWEQPPVHRRTFFVAQDESNASDNNPGTEARPWKTIGRAAATLQPGDRVVVKEGIYRERVRPARGGLGPRRMITYQAAPGQKVIIRGSERFAGLWKVSTYAGISDEGNTATGTADSEKTPSVEAKARLRIVWTAALPETLLGDYNPFAEPNLTDAKSNPYLGTGQGPAQYTMRRGLVFQNARRLQQKATHEELSDAPGTYWVESDGLRLHIRPFGDADPNSADFEVTTREFAFAPDKTGLGFICVDGFTIEHVASCFPIPQRGAISTRQGHHWIIQDNTVRQVNSLGLDFGRRPTFVPFEVPEDTPKLAGVGHIIRRNSFADCGICSMQGLGLIGGLIEDNFSTGCGWQFVHRLWETGGIKLHYLKHTLVRRNRIYGTIDGPGLWVDHSHANSRITQNVIVGAGAPGNTGIFLEASYLPVLIDHNIVWDCLGNAFFQHDCCELIIANNLFGKCEGRPVYMNCNPKRILDLETNRLARFQPNKVHGNIFYGFGGRGPRMPADRNMSDYNLFVDPVDGESPDITAWRKQTGQETHSKTFVAQLDFSFNDQKLIPAEPLPSVPVPRLPTITFDFFQTPRVGPMTQIGPFTNQYR